MKRDEVRKLIENITDEQLDALMNLNGEAVSAERSKAKALQQKLDEANDLLAAAAKENEAKAKESMTIEERMRAMEESYAAKERELAMKQNTLAAREILAGAGLAENDWADLVSAIVTEDGDATSARANALSALISAQRENAKNALKKELLDDMPSPAGSTASNNSVTKDQLKAMSYEQAESLFNSSPDVYKQLAE